MKKKHRYIHLYTNTKYSFWNKISKLPFKLILQIYWGQYQMKSSFFHKFNVSINANSCEFKKRGRLRNGFGGNRKRWWENQQKLSREMSGGIE